MTRGAQARVPHATEIDARADWWLREHGHFPTHEALLAIRDHARGAIPAHPSTTEKENR